MGPARTGKQMPWVPVLASDFAQGPLLDPVSSSVKKGS